MAEKVDQMDPDEKIVEIAIERLRVFENHPFRVEMYCVGAEVLQHSSVATTQRYIDVDQRIDKALIEQCTLF